MDFQTLCSAVILPKESRLDVSRTLLNIEKFVSKPKISKIEKDENSTR